MAVSVGLGETGGRLSPKKDRLRHRCQSSNWQASSGASISIKRIMTDDEEAPASQLEENNQLGPIISHHNHYNHHHHHHQGDNLRMALEERALTSSQSSPSRICGEQQRQREITISRTCQPSVRLHAESNPGDTERAPTIGPGRGRCCVNSNGRHRRRASVGGGNLLTRSLVANQVILMTSLSFLFLLLIPLVQHQPHSHVAALKLPSFLASWIPQPQQQQPVMVAQSQQQVSASQLQDLAAAADLSGDHSSNLLSFSPTTSGLHQATENGPNSPKSKLPTSPLKRPFSGIGKHPIGAGHHHHLFSALPKSLFGRILSGSTHGQQQTQQQQLQQQQVGAAGGAILSPMTRQQQQQLVLAMMANSQKYQASQPTSLAWPYGAPQAAPPSGNYSQHAHMQPHGNFINGNNQQHFAMPGQKGALAVNNLMQQHQQQPITSFRPIAQQQQQQQVAAVSGGQSEPPKKHALGYGESDEDFVIVNAQQVPELQRSPVVQQRPLATPPVPTRHPSEEYREMPAIVIADPDEETVASLGLSANVSQTAANASTSGDHEQVGDLVKLKPLASQNNITIAADANNDAKQTVPDVTPVQMDGNSTISKQPPVDSEQVAASSFESQHQNSSLAADTPESNRQESVASAVIVAASNDGASPQQAHHQQQHHQQSEQEALESFVIGPYKGLSLGDDELASPSAAHHFQTQMESFIDDQQFSFPNYHVHQQQQVHHQQPEQMRHHNHHHHHHHHHHAQQQPAKFGHAHSSGPQNLLGSASNLLQQARQLIQLPFTHLPHNAHLHQQQMPAQQQHHSQYRRPLMHRPQQQQHWPSPMFGMPQQPQQQQFSFYPNFNQQQQVSPSMRSPQMHQQPNAAHGAPQNSQRSPAYFFAGQNFNQPRPSPGNNNFPNQANYNLVLNHGNQMQPSSAYFVDSTHQQQQQQPQLPAMIPMQQGQDSYRPIVAAEMNSNETGGQPLARPAHFAQHMAQSNSKHKSGLYQIEPPKLESDKSSAQLQQQQLGLDNDDDSAQQQQKIDVQENASDEELGGVGGADEDDEQQQDISQQQQQQDNEQKGEQQHQTQQMVAVAEPMPTAAADQQASAANFSHESHQMVQAPNQILQVGASFGVVSNFTAPSLNQTLRQQQQQVVVGVQHHEGRRGQVFNESLGSQSRQLQPQQQQQQQQLVVGQPDHDITTAYEFGQQQAAPEQQQNNYLDTQVYTLPYTMTVQNQVASFAPQQPRLGPVPMPLRSYAPQRQQMTQPQQWQQQQQQMPVPFIGTGEWEGPRQQPLPVPVPPSWANNNNNNVRQQQQFFHHYQPMVDQQSNAAAAQAFAPVVQQTPEQFAFAVQHQTSQMASAAPPAPLLVHQQQTEQQKIESGAPSVEQQQQPQQQRQQQQGAVNLDSATSNSDQMTSSSTTTPSSRVDDSLSQDFSGSLTPQQRQQQQQQQQANQLAEAGGSDQQDRKSQQQQQQQQQQQSRPSLDSSGQTKQVARSPSSFCAGRASGLYADVEQRCKAYYQCAPTGHQMFQCNNQTQFNQKTQNCDWWYNVDCGGRLGSPEDFEQAPSSPRSQLASMDQESATPTSAQATPSFSQSDLAANSQQSTQADLRSFVEPPPSSTLAYNTPPPPATTTQTNVPNATTQTSQQQQQQQQQFESQAATTATATTTTTSTADDRTLSSAQQFSERSSTTPTHQSAGSRISSEQQQQSFAATTASSNQLIEVVNSGQVDSDGLAQPRVGSSLNDDNSANTPTTTVQATPTTTTQQSTTVEMAATTTTTMTTTGANGQQTTEEQAQNEVTTQRELQPERGEKISQVSTAGGSSGKPSAARRFIQSEFGGSSKTARAISRKFKQPQQQQQQVASTGDLLAVDAALAGAPLRDEMSQLHAQEEHHSVRLGSAADVSSQQTQAETQREQQIYSTSANQGSISYDPQATAAAAGVREQQTIDLLGQFPSARMGLVAGLTAASESPRQQPSQLDDQKPTTSRTLERRFGARLPATPKRP